MPLTTRKHESHDQTTHGNRQIDKDENGRFDPKQLKQEFGEFSDQKLIEVAKRIESECPSVKYAIKKWIEDSDRTGLTNLLRASYNSDKIANQLEKYRQFTQWAFQGKYGGKVSLYRGRKSTENKDQPQFTSFTDDSKRAHRFGSVIATIEAHPEDVLAMHFSNLAMQAEGENEFLIETALPKERITLTKHTLRQAIDNLVFGDYNYGMKTQKHEGGGHDQKKHGRKTTRLPDFPVNANLQEISDRLSAAGFKAYVAGGAVRDYIVGKTPKDFDLTTDATPTEVKMLFGPNKVKPDLGGESHGTVRIGQGNEIFEITTHRKDVETDGRHAIVAFSRSLVEDLERRDLTCNAMALDLHDKKLYGTSANGSAEDNIADIEDNVIRFVGVGADRIKEDGLRALRAVRFSIKLNATLHPDAKQAITDAVANGLIPGKLSGERIRDEMIKTFGMGDGARAVRIYKDTGLLFAIFPELKAAEFQSQNKHHGDVKVLEHIMRTTEKVEVPKTDLTLFNGMAKLLFGHRDESEVTDSERNDTAKGILRLTMLMHDIAKPQTAAEKLNAPGEFSFLTHESKGAEIANAITKRLALPSVFVDLVTMGVAEHMAVPQPDASDSSIRRWARRLNDENKGLAERGFNLVDWMMAVRGADWGSLGREHEVTDTGADRIRAVLTATPITTKPPVRGERVIGLTGLSPKTQGRMIGEIVKRIGAFLDTTPDAPDHIIDQEIVSAFHSLTDNKPLGKRVKDALE